jgi:predicted MFS family arabinose efflux permease
MAIVGEAPATGSVTESTEAAGGRLLLATICLAPLVTSLLAVALSPFFPDIAAELGTTVALLGQVTAASMLGAAALGLLVGPLADHYGHRRLLLLGLLAVVASALGTALAPTFALLLVAALVGAVSRAIVQPVSLAVAGERFRGAARRRAISWAVAATAGAPIVGTPAMTSIGAAFGWRAAFVVLGVASLAIAALALRALPLYVAPARGAPARDSPQSNTVPAVRALPPAGRRGWAPCSRRTPRCSTTRPPWAWSARRSCGAPRPGAGSPTMAPTWWNATT